jgi:hypothetical protein
VLLRPPLEYTLEIRSGLPGREELATGARSALSMHGDGGGGVQALNNNA